MPRLPSSSHHDGCALLTGTRPCTTVHQKNHPGGDPPGDDSDGVRAGGGEGREEAGVEEGAEEAAPADRSVPTGQPLS